MNRWTALLLVCGFAGAAPAASDPAVDMEKEKAAIRQADLDMGRAVKEKDLGLFKNLVHGEAVFYGVSVNQGRDAVAQAWSVFFAPDAAQLLLWEPHSVEVAASGDLGYSRGTYELKTLGEGGTSSYGHYVTIWRKGEGSRWQAAVDIGTPPGSLQKEEGAP